MKKNILTTLLLVTCLIYNITAQEISSQEFKKEYIHEDFNEKTNNFKVVTTSDNYFIIDKGDYLLSRNNKESEYAIIAKNSIVSDFILKTEVRIGPSDNKKASLGIIIKAQNDGKGAIILEINKKQEYRITKLINGDYQNISGESRQKGWKKSNLLNGIDKDNSIEIRSEKNTYDVYINNSFLTTFFVANFNSGSCGLIISPQTKARISYYYIDIKGEAELAKNWYKESDANTTSNIQETNQTTKILQEKNNQLNTLNKEIENLNFTIKEITEKNNKLKKLDTEIIILNNTIKKIEIENKEIGKLKELNLTHKKNIKENNQKIEKLNQVVNSKKTEISNLTKKNTELSSVTSKQEKQIKLLQNSVKDLRVAENKVAEKNKKLNENMSGFKKQIKVQKSANTQLINKLKKSDEALNKLKNIQEKHDNKTNSLNTQITNLSKNNKLLSSNLKKANDSNENLSSTNEKLKDLFVMKDFELNGIIPSEMVKENKSKKTSKKINNTETFSVQLGVYMNEQTYSQKDSINNVWYETTEAGTYVYYSGEFNLPEQAAAHMNNLISKGYRNSLIVTRKK